jgi:hypothetical protein
MKRELKLTQDGRIISMFLHMLRSDPDFDIDEPITDTYLFEVGYECGLSDQEIQVIVMMLVNMGLIEFN